MAEKESKKESIEKDYKELGKGSFWLFIGLFFGRFLGIVFTILMTRLFNVDEVGMFYLAFSVINFFTIFTGFELTGTLQTYSAYYYGKQKWDHLRKLIKAIFLVGLATSRVLFIAFLLFSNQISAYFNNMDLPDLIKVFALYFIINSVFTLEQAFTVSFRLTKEASLAQLVQTVSKIVLIPVAIYFFGATSMSLTVLFIISFALGLIPATYHFLKVYTALPAPKKDESTYKEVAS